MTMVPGSSILSDPEFVCEGVTRGNGTLRDSIDAIVLKRVEHANTMPMHGCPIVPKVILHCDFHSITPAGRDTGPGILTVEDLPAGRTIDSIGIDLLVRHVEVILDHSMMS